MYIGSVKIILIPVDFSDVTEKVIASGAQVARAFGAKVCLLHVAASEPEFIGYEPGPQTVRDSVARHISEAHRMLHGLARDQESAGLAATALVVQGYPVEKILSEAAKLGADLIVIGSHGHGMLHHLLVGSVTEGVLKKARCPVLVVPARKA
jgi:nucleotide-binding universal stress UspA family protein